MLNTIGDVKFSDFAEEDRTTLIEAMTALKDTLDEAIPGRSKTRENRHENDRLCR